MAGLMGQGGGRGGERSLAAAMREGMRAGMTPLTPLGASLRDGVLEIFTPRGIILGLHAGPPHAETGFLMVGGALGGFSGPGGTVYGDVASRLAEAGISSLRLHYRRPNDLPECVMDVLLALKWWTGQGLDRAVIAGHSFGGAVAISAGALITEIRGVVGLASQTAGTETVEHMKDKPILLLHGDADPVLPKVCSENIYERANEPKELVILPGCGHLMAEAAGEITERLVGFAGKVLSE
jgi:pimeloyl-ACP methyl ester carboxylesterase